MYVYLIKQIKLGKEELNMIRFKEACGNAGKVVAARLLPDTDLIEGIEEICKSNQIKYAYVSCFGSFKNVDICIWFLNQRLK